MKSESIRGAAPRLLVPLPSGDGRRDARAMADVLRLVVPDLVGLSLVVRDGASGRPWTLAATGADVALLDAVQYLTGGPSPARAAQWVDLRAPITAARWAGLADAAATVGVGAVLVAAGASPDVVVHVYAGSARVATQQVDRVVAALASWTNRAKGLRDGHPDAFAVHLPETGSLPQQGCLARAVACVAVRQGVDVVAAQDRLCDAAGRAGVRDHDLARLLARPSGRRADRTAGRR